jgi:hypothetical protein
LGKELALVLEAVYLTVKVRMMRTVFPVILLLNSVLEEVSKLEDCEEFRFLQSRFSTGVTLRELRSIATIVSLIGGLPAPSRNEKRGFRGLVSWFRKNWEGAIAVLPFVQLRDEDDVPIDGIRELHEKHAKH